MWSRYCSFEELSLHHENPVVFISSQWQCKSTPNLKYLVYRWFIGVTFFIAWTSSIIVPAFVKPNHNIKWPIFLTNWGFTCCMLQAVTSLIMITMCTIGDRSNRPDLYEKGLRLYKLYWLFYTCATDLAFGITIVFWSLLYNPRRGASIISIMVHGLNSVLILVDFWVVGHPVRLLHCVYPCILGLFFALFSGTYYLAGGTDEFGHNYIYHILPWNEPYYALLAVIGVLTFIVCVHLLTFLAYKLRTLVHLKYCSSKEEL